MWTVGLVSLLPKKQNRKQNKQKKTPKNLITFFIDRKLNIKVRLEKIHILTPVNLLLGELGMHFYLLFSLCFVFTVTVRVDALWSTVFFSILFSSFFFFSMKHRDAVDFGCSFYFSSRTLGSSRYAMILPANNHRMVSTLQILNFYFNLGTSR